MTGASGAAPVAEQLEDLPREQQLEQEVAELRLVLKNCLWCCIKQINIQWVRPEGRFEQVGSSSSCSQSHATIPRDFSGQ